MKFSLPHIATQLASVMATLVLTGQLSLPAAPGDTLTGWPYHANGSIFGAPAVSPQGQIVFGTYVGDMFNPDGSVYSLNPDGTVRWVFNGVDWFDSSPAIGSDGTVYIGCWDDYLYALDAHSFKLGPTSYLWRYKTGSAVTATPTIGPDGTIYVGSMDGFMYAIWPEDGTKRWTFENVDDDLSPISAQAILDRTGTTLYFGSDAGILYAVDAATGDLQWSYAVPAGSGVDLNPDNPLRAIYGSPVLGDNGELYFTCENGLLYRINRSNGTWSAEFPAEDSIFSSPVIGQDGLIYFAAADGYLYCVSYDASSGLLNSIWEKLVGDAFYCTPALDTENNIILATYAGDATSGVATDIKSIGTGGTINWTRRIPSLNDSSSNIFPDGSILIGDYGGNLYRVAGEAPLRWENWPRFGSNKRQTGWIADLGQPDLVDYFPDISKITLAYFGEDLEYGASYVGWFGGAHVREAGLPMVEHQAHGILQMAESGPEGVIYWDSNLFAWVFAPIAAPDYLLLMRNGRWIYHARGTIQPNRWFYDLQLRDWLSEDEL